MNRATILSISKLDAAKRQLEVGIRLYFFGDDPVSTYTLGAAAYGLLRDIAKAQGMKLATFRQGMMERVVPGKEKELIAALRRHQNFFKHAERDSDATIDFNPVSTDYILMDGCLSYAQLTKETTPLMGAFSLWWQFENRDLIKEEHSEIRSKLDGHLEYFKNRRVYLSNMLPLLHELHGQIG